MTKIAYLLTVVCALIFALHADPAQAQRVFVSATGSDGNPCSFPSPCRSFQHAHDVAPAHGEIDVLDPAGYGAVTINKAISIQGHGFSGITVGSGGTGITINAGSTDAITLNGLIIDGAHAGNNGIVFNSGGGLTVSNCVVQNFLSSGPATSGNGILLQPTTSNFNFSIANTTVANNDNIGIYYLPPTGSPTTTNGVIDHVVATNNFDGIAIDMNQNRGAAAIVVASNSIASYNSNIGIYGSTNDIPRPLKLSIDNVSITSNGGGGIEAFAYAKVLLGRSVITGNGTGIYDQTLGTFYTYQDNRINLNATDITSQYALTPLAWR